MAAQVEEHNQKSSDLASLHDIPLGDIPRKLTTQLPSVAAPTKFLLRHGRTLLASLSASMGSLGLGTIMGYTSPALPDLSSNPAPFHLDNMGVSLVTSIVCLGGLVGEPVGGFAISRLGRQFSLLLCSLPFVVGWLMIASATNLGWMCAGRLFTGFACGIVDIAVPVYISEIAAPSVRGFMGSCHEFLINVGMLLTFALGCVLPWNWLAVACGAVPVVMLLLMIFMPESPRWLFSNGRKEEAAVALQWFRGSDVDISSELAEIEEALTASGSSMPLRDFREPAIYKPFFIIVGLLFFQQFAGYGVIPAYLGTIFENAGSHMDPNVQTVIVGVAGVLANFLSALLVDKAGRRVMLLVSSLIMTLSLSGLASYFTVGYYDQTFDLSIIGWLPILSLVAYNFGVAFGYGPIPFYLSSELFPLKARGIAGSFGITFVWLFNFLTSFFFPGMLTALHDFGLYWLMAGIAFLGIVFSYVTVPETKGRSLEEIEKHFNK